MTQEIYESLKPFSGHLYTAYYCSFIRLTDKEAKAKLDKLYKDLFGTESNILGGCNRCVLNALKKLGKEYFDYEKEVGSELEPKPKVTENKEVKKTTKKVVTNKKTNTKTK